MKDTGIIRRIDDLGRIVIPKEIRKSLKLKSGDPLEFYSESGALVLKKYSPIENNEQFAISVLNAMSSVLENECLITDLEKIIYSTKGLKHLEGKKVSDKFLEIISDKKTFMLNKVEKAKDFLLVKGEEFNCKNALIVPIIKDGQVFGCVLVSSNSDNLESENSFDLKAVRVCVKLLSENIVSI